MTLQTPSPAPHPEAAPPPASAGPPPTVYPSDAMGGRGWFKPVFRVFVLALVAGMIAFVATQWDWWVGASREQRTDDAYLQADLTPLAAKVPGYVRTVYVKDFQRVKAGDLLVEMVDDDYRAQYEQTASNIVVARAAMQNIEQQKLLQQTLIKQAEANIRAAQADLTRFRQEAARQQTLLAQGLAGTRQQTEQAVANEQRAEAVVAVNQAQLEQQQQQLNVLDSQEKQAHATLNAQQAARDLAQINLDYTKIKAPVDGMVSQRQVHSGQYLSAGTQVIVVVPLPDLWVVANYKETQMTRVRAGQPARVTVDAFPGEVLRGHVESWSPASGSLFSLLPPDNATGNFTKVVQRIPVKIVLGGPSPLTDLLRPGMSVVAAIDTSQTTGGQTDPNGPSK